MSAVAEVAQGTVAGEQAQPVAAPSAAAPSEAQTTTTPQAEPSPAAVNWESVDLESVPKPVIAKLEQRYLKDMQAAETRKLQALAEDRRRLDSIFEKLASQANPQQPNEIEQLRERIRQGEYDLIPELNEKQLKQALGPIETQAAIQNAVTQAQAAMPILRERESDVAQIFASDPNLQTWAFSNPQTNLPYALQGIGLAIQARDLQAKLAASEASREAEVQARVKAELDKRVEAAKGIPTTTSHAGSTPHVAPTSDFGAMTPAQRFVAMQDAKGAFVDPILRERAARGK